MVRGLNVDGETNRAVHDTRMSTGKGGQWENECDNERYGGISSGMRKNRVPSCYISVMKKRGLKIMKLALLGLLRHVHVHYQVICHVSF